MFSSLLSFLGGSAFRMIWGEVSSWLTAKQEHSHEMARMRLQEELDAALHSRNLESIRVQADLGVKTIEVQRDADVSRIESDAWAAVVGSTTKSIGIRFIDAWNGSIRPALATMAMVIVIGQTINEGFVLTAWTMDLVAAILGIYMADRSLMKRGK